MNAVEPSQLYGMDDKLLHMDILDRLLDYDRWITRRVLEHCLQLSDAQRQHQFDIGWETIQATLVHIVRNMELWSDLLHARSPRHSMDREEDEPAIAELIIRHDIVSAEIEAFGRGQAREGNLDGFMLDTLCDPPVATTYGTVLCDIFHENMVHRSEVRHMLIRLGAPSIERYDPMSWEWDRAKMTEK